LWYYVSLLEKIEISLSQILKERIILIDKRMIISKTPLKISFCGGGTDLKDYWEE